jgi:hypothetical protein
VNGITKTSTYLRNIDVCECVTIILSVKHPIIIILLLLLLYYYYYYYYYITIIIIIIIIILGGRGRGSIKYKETAGWVRARFIKVIVVVTIQKW